MLSTWNLITEHPVLPTIVLLWILSAGTSTMPTPTTKSATWYLWLYGFLHLMAANLDKLAAARGIPLPLAPVDLTAKSATDVPLSPPQD